MGLYCGIDLHSTNSYVAVMDDSDRVVAERRLANDLEVILGFLAPYRDAMVGVAVESTYNWYWLVDGLMAAGYRVHLANPAAMQQYSGLKHAGDRSDARWLAHMMRLKVLPEGYIYPAADRGLRDLLRKRHRLVQHRTRLYLSMATAVERTTGRRLGGNAIDRLGDGDVDSFDLPADAALAMAAAAELWVLVCLRSEITGLEKVIVTRLRPTPVYRGLLEVPGIGKILGMTIALETGDIGRFAGVSNYVSYCRCVDAKRVSNGKRKGAGNAKNGNRWLACSP